jgi:23S rRNA (adenine2503-C2)-methyltransferase
MALLGMTAQELTDWVQSQGQPAYRGKQLHEWIYSKAVRNFRDITVFPKQWRETAPDHLIGRSTIVHKTTADDGTAKYLLELGDGKTIETVAIPTHDRLTVCISTQVGCPMACDFCATGKGGWHRNLANHEIIDQVLTVQEDWQRRVTHLVFMGMGEPLLNLDQVLSAIHRLNQDVGIGQRHMTVSTVGVPYQIPKFAQQHLQVTLAVSLHAPDQNLRQQLIPSAKHYPIDRLIADCKEYVQITGRRISFEYTLLAGVNDLSSHAMALAELIRGFQCHVNLIPYNPIAEADYQRPTPQAVQAFVQTLEKLHIAVSVRQTRGLTTASACGQLRSQLGKSGHRDREVRTHS